MVPTAEMPAPIPDSASDAVIGSAMRAHPCIPDVNLVAIGQHLPAVLDDRRKPEPHEPALGSLDPFVRDREHASHAAVADDLHHRKPGAMDRMREGTGFLIHRD